MDTSLLRQHIKSQREQLTPEEIKHTSQRIADRLSQTVFFKNAKHIAYYLPVMGEADPGPLLTTENTGEKFFYLPVLKKNGEIGLNFIRVSEKARFEKNRFDIPEPVFNTDTGNDLIPPHKLDLVVTPLVSFDAQGNRIGMGGGFYDRTFAFKNERGEPESRKPFMVGYAYEFQRSHALQAEPWDVQLDAVVTEKKIYHQGTT